MNNKHPEIHKLQQQKNETRWVNNVMNEIHTSMNDTYFNELRKYVDKPISSPFMHIGLKTTIILPLLLNRIQLLYLTTSTTQLLL